MLTGHIFVRMVKTIYLLDFCEVQIRKMDEAHRTAPDSSIQEGHVMLVKHTFVPYNKDELGVKIGMLVYLLYLYSYVGYFTSKYTVFLSINV